MGGRNREEETDGSFSADTAKNFVVMAIIGIDNANGAMAWADTTWQERHLSQGVLPDCGLDS